MSIQMVARIGKGEVNEYAVKSNKDGKVEAIRNVTKNIAVPLSSDTGKRIIKKDRRYVVVG